MCYILQGLSFWCSKSLDRDRRQRFTKIHPRIWNVELETILWGYCHWVYMIDIESEDLPQEFNLQRRRLHGAEESPVE